MRTPLPSDLTRAIDPHWRIGIVASSYYGEEIEALVAGAMEVLTGAGITPSHIYRINVPGSFEIPLLGAALAEAKKVDALLGLGIIVEGETRHAQLLAQQSARGIMDVQLQYQIPFAFEVLYVHTIAQARERTVGDGNKGREAARAVLHSLAELKRIRS